MSKANSKWSIAPYSRLEKYLLCTVQIYPHLGAQCSINYPQVADILARHRQRST